MQRRKSKCFLYAMKETAPAEKENGAVLPFPFPPGLFMFRCDFLKRTHFLESGIGFRV